jgi:hypothetical protein
MRRVKGPQHTPAEAPGEAQLDVAFRFEATAEVWLYEGKGGWHFVSLPVGPTRGQSVRGSQPTGSAARRPRGAMRPGGTATSLLLGRRLARRAVG